MDQNHLETLLKTQVTGPQPKTLRLSARGVSTFPQASQVSLGDSEARSSLVSVWFE